MVRREYPDAPIPAVGAFLVEGGELLLVKRAQEPGAGKWSVPGGAIEVGEKAEEALRREVREELGINISSTRLLDIYDSIFLDEKGRVRYHYVIIEFIAKPSSRTIKPSEEIIDYIWVKVDKVLEMSITPSLRLMIKRHRDVLRSY